MSHHITSHATTHVTSMPSCHITSHVTSCKITCMSLASCRVTPNMAYLRIQKYMLLTNPKVYVLIWHTYESKSICANMAHVTRIMSCHTTCYVTCTARHGTCTTHHGTCTTRHVTCTTRQDWVMSK